MSGTSCQAFSNDIQDYSKKPNWLTWTSRVKGQFLCFITLSLSPVCYTSICFSINFRELDTQNLDSPPALHLHQQSLQYLISTDVILHDFINNQVIWFVRTLLRQCIRNPPAISQQQVNVKWKMYLVFQFNAIAFDIVFSVKEYLKLTLFLPIHACGQCSRVYSSVQMSICIGLIVGWPQLQCNTALKHWVGKQVLLFQGPHIIGLAHSTHTFIVMAWIPWFVNPRSPLTY